MLLCDFYKVSHREQYPKGTEIVYSTWTPRESKIENINKIVVFGLQGFIKKYLMDYFNENFFVKPLKEIIDEYERIIKFTLNIPNPSSNHIAELHKLGFLPIKIKALKEGTIVPIRVPVMTIENTIPDFFWITNYLETLLSCELWLTITSATKAFEYKKILTKYARETDGNTEFVKFQGHDFSMRGMSSLESSIRSGAAHLLSFFGTDTIPAIIYHEKYYNANIEKEMVGTSIPATEHSVMCAHGFDEVETLKYLLTEIYPKGFISVVSDTWDLWKFLNEHVRSLKEIIKSREGKLVIRPDSGDPVKIICGNEDSDNPLEKMGVIEILWSIFGGTITAKGFKLLAPHIGCVYGDAITIERCKEICKKLKKKGFSSTNMVYGIGSFTYQYNTRDTFGFALKATYTKCNGEEKLLFKNPITDSGMKKSQKGKVVVINGDDDIVYKDGLNTEQEEIFSNAGMNLLEAVFENGKLLREESLSEIRERLNIELNKTT
jgi:nicotinamide phosphoribosyltransferase